MRRLLTHHFPLAALGLLSCLGAGRLHAQTLDPKTALAQALDTRAQWAGANFPAADVRVSSAYADPGGLEHIYVQQLYRGIPLFNQMQSLAFSKGKLALHTGRFVSSKPLEALSATPTLPAEAAVSRTLQYLQAGSTAAPPLLKREPGPEAAQVFDGTGVARHDITASLVWAFDEQQRPHLAWNVSVDMLESPDWWNVRIDAVTGAVVSQDNWTQHEDLSASAACADAVAASAAAPLVLAPPPPPPANSTASYLVIPFPVERPTSASTLQTQTDPWLKAGASNPAVTYGWHFDGTNSYNYTRGNNVAAYDDGATTNAPGNYAPSQTAAPGYTFNYLPSYSTSPMLDANRNAATTNLFYWNNIIHDVFYQYGFTEPAGNFQADNLGRGGVGNDYVRAEAQDGSGLNNANFSTPNDGSSGRMQMYLWNIGTPTYRLTVTAPSAVAGLITAPEGRISANNGLNALGPLSGTLALYADASGGTSTGCSAASNASTLAGKIALLYRSANCRYITQVKNAQNAGAIAVIMINNVTTAPVVMSGTDNTILIPAVMISSADGARLVAQLANTVQVTLPQNTYTQEIDGDYDSGVMVHEYGHGLSTRLTGGPANSSCLGNAEQAGEGWSDYVGLMLTTNWATATVNDGPNRRPIGTYVYAQGPTASGIRRYPYSTNMSIDPLTYANVATSPEVHNIGEVWCSTLWDMTWNIIQQRNAIEPNLYNGTSTTGGNVIAFQLVTQGMKLQPCQPGFLDGRDAILAADSLLYQGQYHCAIWQAFARRGMGYSAKQGLSTNATDQTVAFDLPPGLNLKLQDGLRTGSTFTVAFTLNSDCQNANGYTLTSELPTGLQYVGSTTGGTLVGNKVTFSNLSATAPGQTRTLSFQAQAVPSASCPITLPINDNRDANQTGGFTSASLSGTAGWTTSNTYAVSGNAWYATAPSVPTDFVLTSSAFTPTGLSTLAFYHYFDFEPGYDGGTVEISTNNGTSWQDAGSLLVQNGYTGVLDPSTSAPNQAAFTGRSIKGNVRFIQSLVDLRSFAGQSVRIRFRVRTDNGSPLAYDGWYLDEIRVLNGCGGYQKVELRDANGNLQTSQNIVTYLVGPLGTQPTLAAASQLTASPNPFGASGLQVQLTMPAAQAGLRFTLYDVAGRALRQQTVAQAPAGTSTLSWSETATLPAGLYLLRLQLPDGSTQTLRVVRE